MFLRVDGAGLVVGVHKQQPYSDIDGLTVQEVPDSLTIAAGWTYADGVATAPTRPVVAPTALDVDAEWTRRVNSGFDFQGETYHSDPDSITNIMGAVVWAQDAISNGVAAGNLYWQASDPSNPGTGDLPFAWKSRSNGMITMDAPTVVAFGKAAAKWKQDHFIAARAIKDLATIPADYAADSRWP